MTGVQTCALPIYLFIYFWLCWVFVSVRGLSLVAASGGHSSSLCTGLSLSWPLLLWSTSSRRTGSVIVAHGPSCSAACGIFPDQGSNPCPLHWQADSQPLHHQGKPRKSLFETFIFFFIFVFISLTLGGGSKRILLASLVAQWLRICLPMQGTWVRALVWEDPTCCGATRPVSHNY